MIKGMLIGIVLAAGPLWAQPAGRAPQDRHAAAEVRYQIGVMERVLEVAVQHGAKELGRRMQSLTPNLLLFTGPARARGFRLEGYGVFFDVEVPALRRSVMWSVRALSQDFGASDALQSLRAHVKTMPSGRERTTLEQALKRLELEVAPMAAAPPAAKTSPAVRAASPAAPRVAGESVQDAPAPEAATLEDPNDAYELQVKDALMNAMLDHSGPMPLGPEEWLTVAARDNEDRLTAGDMFELVTIVLRIKGSDLAAFRSDRLTRDEARKRVDVHEF